MRATDAPTDECRPLGNTGHSTFPNDVPRVPPSIFRTGGTIANSPALQTPGIRGRRIKVRRDGCLLLTRRFRVSPRKCRITHVESPQPHYMEVLKKLFERRFNSTVARVQPLQGHLGGSGRKIIRLADENRSVIGVLYDVREENVAFLEFSRHFRKHALPVPEIYAEDLSQGAYLEEDLGDTTLFDYLSANRSGDDVAPEAIEAYRKVIGLLPRFQIEAGRDLNYKVCYPRGSFDRQSIAWDLNYFKYYFLKLAGIPFNEQQLEDDFSRLSRFLLSADRDYFLYRDFQSRNIMLRDGKPFFVDYQGGRKGALQYDVASLLYDAKADLPPQLREQLLEHYLDALSAFLSIDREAFLRHYYAYVYVRIMQALGAYVFRGFYERKAHFLQSVPYALKNVRWLLHNVELPLALPSLMEAFRGMLGSEKLQGLSSEPEQ